MWIHDISKNVWIALNYDNRDVSNDGQYKNYGHENHSKNCPAQWKLHKLGFAVRLRRFLCQQRGSVHDLYLHLPKTEGEMKTKIMRTYQKPVVQRLDGAISPTFSILFVVMYLGSFSKHLTVPLGLKLGKKSEAAQTSSGNVISHFCNHLACTICTTEIFCDRNFKLRWIRHQALLLLIE